MKKMSFLCLLFLLPVSLPAQETSVENVPAVEEILRKVDDMFRQEHSITVMEMHVKTERYERTMKMKAISLGTEKSLITILEPAKEAGTATLKVGDNIWNYLPKVERTMKIPSGMMGGAWMGSHFSNDDLVRENRFSEDFETKILEIPSTSANKHYVIEMIPKEDTAVVWGKIVSTSTADLLPVDVKYYDEEGTLMRIDKFEDIREVDGIRMPMKFSVLPQDKPGESTTITYVEIDFKTPVSEKEFSLQALRK